MRVSVVIPTYNSGPLVVEAVESVLAQTRPANEILVIDDGSTDDTAERLAPFGAAIRYIRKENGGVATARNRGVAEATGDAVAFLDADDVWHPRKLELQLSAFAARPDLAMLGTQTYAWPVAVHFPLGTVNCPEPAVVLLKNLIIRNAFVTSTVIARRDVLSAVGEFDTDQFGTEDYDLWLRVAQKATVANIPLPLTGYRAATPGSLSKNAARMEAGMRTILRKLAAIGVFRGRPLLRHKAWGYFHYSCGYMHAQAGNSDVALSHVARSLLWYPLLYNRSFVRYPFGRIRLLIAAVLKSGGKPASVR